MPPNPFTAQQVNALWAYLNSMKPPAHRAPGVPAPVAFKTTASAPAKSAETKAPPASPPPTAKPAAEKSAATGASPAGDVAAGHAVFQQHACLACHGPTAQGTAIAPPLAGIGHYLSKSTFSSLVHHPNAAMRAKGMPPNDFSDQQINNLWAYLNSMPPPAHRGPGVPAVTIFKTAEKAPAQTTSPAQAAPPAQKSVVKAAPAPTPAAAKPAVHEAAISGPAAAGKQIFESHGCIACHGANGEGTPLAISLIGITKTVPHDQLIALIRQPNAKMKAGGMPTFGFNNTQLNQVVAYLATLKKPTPGAAKAKAAMVHHPAHKLTPLELAGKRVYFKQRCSTCHGDGSMQGTAAAPSLTSTASELPPAMIEHLLLHPSQAMQSNGMPAIDLNKADMKALIAFVRSLRYNR